MVSKAGGDFGSIGRILLVANITKLVTVVLWLSSSFFMIGCRNDRPLRHPALPLNPPRHGGIYVIAHRGAHNGIPENSLPAYQKAIDLGADL